MACAWLIRRFIDREAEFIFVTDRADVPKDATLFDMRGAELGHHGDDCTFESILRRYGLDDPVLWELARIVHEADLGDEKFDVPEAPGLDVVCRGISMIKADDAAITIAEPIFDALYEYKRRALLLGKEPS